MPVRSTGLAGLPVTTGAHYSANSYAQTPTGAASPGVTYTGSMYANNAAGVAFNGKLFYVAFTRSAGGDDFSQTTTVNVPTGVSRISFSATAPALATGVYLILDTFNATLGSGVDLTACLLEATGSLDTYFDGNTSGASWDGTADDSTSTLADVGVTPNGIPITLAAGSPSSTYGLSVTPTGVHPSLVLGNPRTVTAARGNGWASFDAIIRRDVEEYQRERLAPITVCPFHNERLETGPREELHCPFGGEVFNPDGSLVYGWENRLGEDWPYGR